MNVQNGFVTLRCLPALAYPGIWGYRVRGVSKAIPNEEIWNAVKNIGLLKAPGLEGIHAIFYQNCWDIVGDSICDLVKDFFNNNSSLRLINHTNSALIPNVDNPKLVNQYKPTSLYNVTNKIITKVLVNRLKPILADCISENQGAFASERSIHDNILIAHELFSSFKNKTR